MLKFKLTNGHLRPPSVRFMLAYSYSTYYYSRPFRSPWLYTCSTVLFAACLSCSSKFTCTVFSDLKIHWKKYLFIFSATPKVLINSRSTDFIKALLIFSCLIFITVLSQFISTVNFFVQATNRWFLSGHSYRAMLLLKKANNPVH